MKSDNKSFWQRVAKLYGPVMEKSSAALYGQICRRIRPHLTPDMHVLELACGTGQLSYPLSVQVACWEATDFSAEMVAQAQKKAPTGGLRFSVQDATALPYPPEHFDAVVISNALHIMPNPEKALAEIHRVLKPAGTLFAPTFLHSEHTGFRLRVWLMELAGFHTYHKWTMQTFLDYLSAHSFDVTDSAVLGDSLAPLGYAAAKKASPARDA